MEIREAVAAQKAFYATGVTRSREYRREQLRHLKRMIIAYEKRIEEALWEDLHKSAYESYLTEISLVLEEIRFHLKHLRRWTAPRRVATPYTLWGHQSRILYEPLGTALIIAPWNYPFQLLFMPLIGAVSAGNCILLKPSHKTPHVAALMEEMFSAFFDPGYITVVQGGEEIYAELLKQRFELIFFTGGKVAGKNVMRAAAEHLTPVILELGGKSPCIVDESADLAKAARRIVWGKYINAGQTCVAPDYLLVHVRIKDKFLKQIVRYIQEFYGENPKLSPDYPRIVNAEAFDRLERFMQTGKIVCGGETDREELYIAPTVLDEVLPDDPVMQEEIFGPLLPVLEFARLEEAIHYINAGEKPLALYYFGGSDQGKQVLESASSGGVCINDTVLQLANPHLPFGGVGNSGMGRYHGEDSFLAFSHKRSVLYAKLWGDIPLRYPPYRHLNWLKRLM